MHSIVIFGMGGIGGYVGSRIALGTRRDVAASEAAHAGAVGEPELTFVARGAHLAKIRTDGLRFRDPAGHESVIRPKLATDDVSHLGIADVVFVSVKGYDLEGACRSIQPLVGPKTVVVPLLNGADIHERVRTVIKSGVVLPAAIYISAAIAAPGVVAHVGGKGNIVLGREPGKVGFDKTALLALLDRSGIPYEWFEDPMPAVWTKFLFIASFGLVTGMSGKTIGEVIADSKLAALTQNIQAEIVALARAKGIGLPADAAAAAFEKGKAFPPETKSSYQRDREVAGKPNEGDLFGGTIMRLGKELGVPTPTAAEVFATIGR